MINKDKIREGLRKEWYAWISFGPKGNDSFFSPNSEQMADWWLGKIDTLIEQRDREIKKKIENWKYGYDNYMTMMNAKKDFDKGNMAREVADEILVLLDSTNK